jgi:RNA polymerase sigma-70 factor (sigma-E family)
MVDEEFTDFVRARGAALRRTAFFLTGDWQEAEDVTQTSLARLYVAWGRVESSGADAYARRIVVRSVVDARRRFWRRERPAEVLPDTATVPDDPTEDRLDLVRALAMLAPRQRALLVLRYWDDLPVTQVAEVLSMSPGTVKSGTARALESLRRVLGADAVSVGRDVS